MYILLSSIVGWTKQREGEKKPTKSPAGLEKRESVWVCVCGKNANNFRPDCFHCWNVSCLCLRLFPPICYFSRVSRPAKQQHSSLSLSQFEMYIKRALCNLHKSIEIHLSKKSKSVGRENRYKWTASRDCSRHRLFYFPFYFLISCFFFVLFFFWYIYINPRCGLDVSIGNVQLWWRKRKGFQWQQKDDSGVDDDDGGDVGALINLGKLTICTSLSLLFSERGEMMGRWVGEGRGAKSSLCPGLLS